MPDTGEDREIRQRVNAKEAEVVSEAKKLWQKSKPRKNGTVGGFRAAKKKPTVPIGGIRGSGRRS
jgi:hypothetical protein